ncbi:MAG: hypothetical protein DI527_07750 [Chelatococcus sp.]|nr:MAG: hypothetical protein DI527_07750 [Chelatococcus sp.]
MGNKHDPDLDPIVPPPGAPDRIGVARSAPAGASAAVVASAPAPVIAPADPAAWSTTVQLDHALLVDGERLDAVTLRRPTGADIAELMEHDPNEATLPTRLRARICGVHPAVFGAMWPDDSERVAEAARPFLPRAILDIEAAPEAAGETD